MKRLLLTLLLLASPTFAVLPIFSPQSACVTATGGAAIPTTYSLVNAQSLMLTVAAGTAVTHFAVTTNTLSSAVAFSISTSTTSGAPSASSNVNQLFLDSGLLPALDGIKMGNAILLRSNTGSTITSGTICILVW